MEPKPFALEAQRINHWTAREVPTIYFSRLLDPISSLPLPHLMSYYSPCISYITPHPPPPAVLQLLWRFRLMKNLPAMFSLFLQIQKSASSLRAFALASSCAWNALFLNFHWLLRASLVAQMVKCLPVMWETWVRSLEPEDPLEKEMATHSSTLAWKIPWMEEPGRLQCIGSQRVRDNWATSLLDCSLIQISSLVKLSLNTPFKVIQRAMEKRREMSMGGIISILLFILITVAPPMRISGIFVFSVHSFISIVENQCLADRKRSRFLLMIIELIITHTKSEKVKALVAQLYPTLCDSMDRSLTGFSVYGILLARILDWVAIPFSKGYSRPRDWTGISCIAGRFFTIWATREAPITIGESE